VLRLGALMRDARLAGASPEPRKIEAPIGDGRAVKANISLDRGLLDAIDAAARRGRHSIRFSRKRRA
jgi:hypothetical protein